MVHFSNLPTQRDNPLSKIKHISLLFLGFFYLAAGINHFINPEFYLQLIPPYLPFHDLLNSSSGIIEIILGIGVLVPSTRTWASFGIIALLIALIPAHVFMIQMGGVMSGGLTMPQWFAWFRLFPLQFLLMLWAWWHRR